LTNGLFFRGDDEHVEGLKDWRWMLKSSEKRIVWKSELIIAMMSLTAIKNRVPQEQGTAEWRALRNTIFLVVDGGVVD